MGHAFTAFFCPPCPSATSTNSPSQRPAVACKRHCDPHFLQWEPTTPPWRFFDREEFCSERQMSLLFYLTLFIVMCVFGWSVRGAG